MALTRKCFYCKKQIDLDNDNFIYMKKKYYHFDCVIEKQLNKKRNKLSKEECIANAIVLQKEGQKEFNKILNKEKLFKWLQYNYNVVVIPKFFYIKMDSIFEGTYKGLSRGISPEDLLDMWKRKKMELDKINDINAKKGKILVGCDRIQYDLAILLSKYDSYLKWKEQQKILEQERQNIKENLEYRIDFTKVHISPQNISQNTLDISDIIDEI